MIITVIVVCEIAFWVAIISGLALRYLARMPRAGLLVLALVPLIDLVLLIATAVNLRSRRERNRRPQPGGVLPRFLDCLRAQADPMGGHSLRAPVCRRAPSREATRRGIHAPVLGGRGTDRARRGHRVGDHVASRGLDWQPSPDRSPGNDLPLVRTDPGHRDCVGRQLHALAAQATSGV